MSKIMVQHKEIDIENFIWDALKKGHRQELAKRGLSINGRVYRQFLLPGCGIADLVSFEKKVFYSRNVLCVEIFELKRGTATASHLLQLLRYESFFSNNLKMVMNYFQVDRVMPVDCYLIGQDFEKDVVPGWGNERSAANYLKYSFSFDSGLLFESQSKDYAVNENDFKKFNAIDVLSDEFTITEHSYKPDNTPNYCWDENE